MHLNKNTVLVDTDFIINIIETKLEVDVIIKNLNELFAHLEVSAVIHPLVHEKEIPQNNQKLNRIFDEGSIKIMTFDDIFNGDKDKKAYYIYIFKELYNSLWGTPIQLQDDEVFTKWMSSKSLGEIHSITTCVICEAKVFLSDDGDSKHLRDHIKNNLMVEITVYDRKELFDEYLKTGGTQIPRKERQKMAHERC